MARGLSQQLCDKAVEGLDLMIAFGRAEHCYKMIDHMSIGMTPFRALYGYDALSFADIFLETAEPQRPKIGS